MAAAAAAGVLAAAIMAPSRSPFPPADPLLAPDNDTTDACGPLTLPPPLLLLLTPLLIDDDVSVDVVATEADVGGEWASRSAN